MPHNGIQRGPHLVAVVRMERPTHLIEWLAQSAYTSMNPDCGKQRRPVACVITYSSKSVKLERLNEIDVIHTHSCLHEEPNFRDKQNI